MVLGIQQLLLLCCSLFIRTVPYNLPVLLFVAVELEFGRSASRIGPGRLVVLMWGGSHLIAALLQSVYSYCTVQFASTFLCCCRVRAFGLEDRPGAVGSPDVGGL